MNLNYLVNRVSEHPEVRSAEIDGETMNVTVPCLEVELVDESGRNGSQTLRFYKGEDKDAARAKYVQGSNISITV